MENKHILRDKNLRELERSLDKLTAHYFQMIISYYNFFLFILKTKSLFLSSLSALVKDRVSKIEYILRQHFVILKFLNLFYILKGEVFLFLYLLDFTRSGRVD